MLSAFKMIRIAFFHIFLLAGLVMLVASAARADIHYVSKTGGHVPPYTTWATASTNIQEAVDAASNGDTVLVRDGVYDTGTRNVLGADVRVAVNKPIIVRSLNGRAHTTIRGSATGIQQVPVSCCYLAFGAALHGFALEDGESVAVDIAAGVTMEADCQVVNCRIEGNTASHEDGISACRGGSLERTIVRENHGPFTIDNSQLLSCIVAHNTCIRSRYHAAVRSSSVAYSTVIYNQGIGLLQCRASHSVIYYNGLSAENHLRSKFHNSCTFPVTPTYDGGTEVETGDMLFYLDPATAQNLMSAPLVNRIDATLLPDSPCRHAATVRRPGPDVYGRDPVGPGSIGAAEFDPQAFLMSPRIQAEFAEVCTDFEVAFHAVGIPWPGEQIRWDFGDGPARLGGLNTNHTFDAPGTYSVSISNPLNPAQVTETDIVVRACAPVYVSTNGLNRYPYHSVEDAASSFYQAVRSIDIPGTPVFLLDRETRSAVQTFHVAPCVVMPFPGRTCKLIFERPMWSLDRLEFREVELSVIALIPEVSRKSFVFKNCRLDGEFFEGAEFSNCDISFSVRVRGSKIINSEIHDSKNLSRSEVRDSVIDTIYSTRGCVIQDTTLFNVGFQIYSGLLIDSTVDTILHGSLYLDLRNSNVRQSAGAGVWWSRVQGGRIGDHTGTGCINSFLDGVIIENNSRGYSDCVARNCIVRQNRGWGAMSFRDVMNTEFRANGSGGLALPFHPGTASQLVYRVVSIDNEGDGIAMIGSPESDSASLPTVTESEISLNTEWGIKYCHAQHCTIANNELGGVYGGSFSSLPTQVDSCQIFSNRIGVSHGMVKDTDIFCNWNSGATYSTLEDCRIFNNAAIHDGGGLFRCQATGCDISGNTAESTGGGAYLSQLYNCTLSNNVADVGGGGFGGQLSHCHMVSNRARRGGGFAVSSFDRYSTMTGGTLSFNTAEERGGGAYLPNITASAVHMDRVEIEGNVSGENGGGLYGEVNLRHCRILDNEAAASGGGIYWTGQTNNSLFGLTILNNRAAQGGGLYLNERGLVMNSLLANNVATARGGGIFGADWLYLDSCTIVSNVADERCGGLFLSNAWAYVDSSIVIDNRSGLSNFSNFDQSNGRLYTLSPLLTKFAPGVDPADIPGDVNPGHLIACCPNFLDPASGDYRLLPGSSAIDAGQSLAWKHSETDLEGNPRLLGSNPDLGCYEFAIRLDVGMRLDQPVPPPPGTLPGGSPYLIDLRESDADLDGAIDYVLVELRDLQGQTLWRESALLTRQGQLRSLDNTLLSVPFAAGEYRLIIKHRNHVPTVAAVMLEADNQGVLRFNFSESTARYLDPGLTALDLGSQVVTRGGDASGDGRVNAIDLAILESQIGAIGYALADFNLDGIVNEADRTIVLANQGSGSSIDLPGVELASDLIITPRRQTLLTGESVVLQANANNVFWAVEHGPSGGSLNRDTGDNVTYTAGNTPGVVDQVLVWNRSNSLARVYLNVISPTQASTAGKALIVAGGRDLDDPVWASTRYLGDRAFNTLLTHRGYARGQLEYLSFGPQRDADGNGLLDDIDHPQATGAEVQQAFTQWAADASRLFVYLVDHGADFGGAGRFRLNANEFVHATEIDAWLDQLQDATDMDVTVVLDFCYSGSFLDELTYDGPAERVVVASASQDELTYFIARGQVSFSEFFFTGVALGYDVWRSFELGADAMAFYQTAVLDDNGDGHFTRPGDGAIAEQVVVGASPTFGLDLPQLGSVIGRVSLQGESSTLLSVSGVQSAYGLERVWCMVIPPHFDPDPTSGAPVIDVPEYELTYNPLSGRYEVEVDGFNEAGAYVVNFYARDVWGSVSPPQQTVVTQEGVSEHVVLIAAGDPSDPQWAYRRDVAEQAYLAYRQRRIPADRIHFHTAGSAVDLDQDGTNDVDGTTQRAVLEDLVLSLTNQADKLTLHILGTTESGALRLNATQTAPIETLRGWLTNQQAEATVILDFAGSEAYLRALHREPWQPYRLVIATTAKNRPASFGRRFSFTSFFINELTDGRSVGEALQAARRAIRRASGSLRQKVLVDDDGDGIPNEKGIDGFQALHRYLGSAFITGEDVPNIGRVTPDLVLSNTAAATLFATDVTDADGIDLMWCVITRPDHTENEAGESNTMSRVVANRFELPYNAFQVPGVYTITYYALDRVGTVSAAAQSQVVQLETDPFAFYNPALPDRQEPDNRVEEASFVQLPLVQYHSLHLVDDCDWVKFYASSGEIYDIETMHLASNLDTVVEIWRETDDGPVRVDRIDEFGVEQGELTGLDFPDSGMYYIRVCRANGSPVDPSDYLLVIYNPTGNQGITIYCVNALNNRYLPGVQVRVSGQADQWTSEQHGRVNFSVRAGTYTLQAITPDGYVPYFHPLSRICYPGHDNASFANPVTIQERYFRTSAYGSLGPLTEFAQRVFFFYPVATIIGRIEDTEGNPISGASLVASSRTQTFAGFPWQSCASRWVSGSDGSLPSNLTVLPGADFTLRVFRPGYESRLIQIGDLGPGSRATVSPIQLRRAYSGNGIQDLWELQYGLPVNGDPTADHDGDGYNDCAEYQIGSNPQVAGEEFVIPQVTRNAEGIQLHWQGYSGRNYRIYSTEDITRPFSQWIYRGYTSYQQPDMDWTDTRATQAAKFFIIQVERE